MLLEALLGGSPYLVSCQRKISESVGFVPQETLVVSGSVKENILMGRPLSEERLRWAISAACMETDLKLLSHGVDTIVGERGTSLSGGQQQRVCIARALYSEVKRCSVTCTDLENIHRLVCPTARAARR